MNQPISLQATPARPQLQISAEPQLVYVLLTARTAHVPTRPMPLNLCLVLDRSSSMRGERLFQVKTAARQLVDSLDKSSAFGLVAFNDRAEVLVPSQLVRELDQIRSTIAELDARGGTEMAQGLALGLQEVERPRLDAIHRLILLTDGRTYGDEPTCIELARRAQRRGIGLTALGIGTEWNEDLLETMTTGPNSRTQYITSSDEIVRVFDTELQRLRATIARNAELMLTLHPDATLRSLHRVQPFVASIQAQVSHGSACVMLGEWTGSEDQQFLLELIVPPMSAGSHPVARIDLRYDLVGGAGSHTASAGIQLPAVAATTAHVDPAVKSALERVVAYQLQSRAWHSVVEGRIDEAVRYLRTASTHLFNTGEVTLAETVQAEAVRLLQQGSASADGRKRIKYGTRGLVAGA